MTPNNNADLSTSQNSLTKIQNFKPNHRTRKLFILTILSFTFLWISLYAISNIFLADRVMFSTSVSGQDLSFKTEEEVNKFFENFVKEEIPLKIRLIVDGVATEVSKDEFDFKIDSSSIMQNGKGGLFSMAFATINNLKGSEVNDFVRVETSSVTSRLPFRTGQENAIYVDESEFLMNCSSNTYNIQINTGKLEKEIWNDTVDSGEINIISSDYISSSANDLLEHCTNYNTQITYLEDFAKSLDFASLNEIFAYKFTSNKKGWIVLDDAIFSNKITEYKSNKDKSADEGQYEIINNQIYLLTFYQVGQIVNLEKSNESISSWLVNPTSNSPFVIDETQPELLSKGLPIRDFTRLMGYGVAGIDMDRDNTIGQAGNAVAGFKEIHNVVLSPGQIFSFHNNLNYIPGTSTTAKGNFVGMGVCTTVTTLFRAVLDSGLEVVERENHGEYIEKYRFNPNNGDPNNRDLVDATYFGDPRSIVDFKFKNNFSNEILIRTEVWYERGQQYHRVEIRSAIGEPEREVWLGNWRISNRRSSRVFNSYFDRVVKIGEQVVLQDSYFSDYQR